ncbi:MAG TPA: ABC transporter permease [Pirellulales bacterium]|jgi:putative ABC transport system permease protein|nr:ABC transporter permease [Pirellulales bacterium]
MNFAQLLVRNVCRRKLRSVFTCLGVALAVATTVTLVGFSSGLQRSTAEAYEGRGIDLVVVRTGVTQRLTSSLDQSIGRQLRSVPGVDDVNPSQTDLISFGEGSLVGIPVHGWPVDGFAMRSLTITSGRLLSERDADGILLGESLAASLNKRIGDQVEVELKPFTVAGIFAGINVYDNMTAVSRLADLQTLMDRPGEVTEFQVKLAPRVSSDRSAADRVRQLIEHLHDAEGQPLGIAALPARQFVENSTEMGLARAMAWGTSALAMIIGSLQVLNTMLMSVFERVHEIGVLKALGWSTSRVVRMIVGEALAICGIGACVGVALGVGIVRGLSATAWLGGLLRPEVAPPVLLASVGAALVIGALGGFYPAWRAAKVSVLQSLRYE